MRSGRQAVFLTQLMAANRLLVPIPNGVPSGFAQTAPFAGTGGPIAQPAQGFHGSEPLTHGPEGDNNTGLQVLESPDDPLLTGEQPQNRETDSQAKSEGESKTN